MSPVFSIDELSQITGKDRRTVKKRLGRLEPVVDGGNAGIRYESQQALPLIYESERSTLVEDEDGGMISLDRARTLESIEKRTGLKIDNETKMKTRIPIELVNDALDAAFGEIKAIISKLSIPEEERDQIFAELRDVPSRLKW